MVFVVTKMSSTVRFNNGIVFPTVGLGTWQSTPDEVLKAVKNAIDCGYRHIDTAFAYQNETSVGEAIREKIADGTVKREEIFVTTKLTGIHTTPELACHGVELSLKNLGLDYIDLYLIHAPMAMEYINDDTLFPMDEHKMFKLLPKTDRVGVWKLMEQFVDEGKVKSIGVSNFNKPMVEEILENCRIPPVVNQVEAHIYWPQYKLHKFLSSKNILLTAYSPLASPGKTRFSESPQDPILDIKLLEDPALVEIGKKHGKPTANIALRWLVQRGLMVLPKSVTPKRIENNFQLFDFELDDEDLETIQGLSEGCNVKRRFFLPFIKNHPDDPFGEE